jgi:hypothetical protein
MAIAAGAAGIGVGSAINQLDNEVAMGGGCRRWFSRISASTTGLMLATRTIFV